MTPIQKEKFEAALAAARAKLSAAKPTAQTPPQVRDMGELINEYEVELKEEATRAIPSPVLLTKTPKEVALENITNSQDNGLVWNSAQQEAIDRAIRGEDHCLIGKAGTGKTTVTREVISRLIREGIIGPLTSGTKYLRTGSPGVCVVSFTNRAVKNIAKGLPKDLQGNARTIHKLLEFGPERFEIQTATGEWKSTMRFVPKRTRVNPLPSDLRCIIFEESSMVSVELFNMLMEAIPHECQLIFLGDLQQLPPVYGSAILGFKLLELPVVELTEIYRQAAGSPIISFAWKIALGTPIPSSEFENLKVPGKLQIRPWKKRLSSEDALHIVSKLFNQLIDQGEYLPEEDMVMIPFNKKFGTDEFNKNMAQHLGVKRKAVVYEIIAGFQKHYYAVGDKVLVEKTEAIVREIVPNGRYTGAPPLSPSTILNRWGVYNMDHPDAPAFEGTDPEDALAEIENFMLATSGLDQDEESKQQASHIMKCQVIGGEEDDEDSFIEISTAGEFSAASFSYALTIHKCQGSEWRKCFLLLHKSHAVMLCRELLYTAVTRARESLYIICEPDSLEKGVKTQRIKGNTIKEKAEFFKGKLEERQQTALGGFPK